MKTILENQLRRVVMEWFRRNHNSTNPAQESHSHFIGCLNKLEGLLDILPIDDIDHIDHRAQWNHIRDAINLLSQEQLKVLHFFIKNNR